MKVSATVLALVLVGLPLTVVGVPVKEQKQEGAVDRQPNFDTVSYLGRWFEIYRSKNMPFEVGTDNEANYALNPNGTVAVRNLEWRYDRWAEALAVATVVDNARLTVDFFFGTPGDYQVMKTDYETYAFVYSYAGKVGQRKIQYGWILARQTTLPQSIVDQAFEIFEEQAGMKRSDFIQTQHGVAPIPPPAASTRAVARKAEGEVDRQPNFDANRYLGKWFEIYRSKNMPFEVGTDNEANYALNPNGTVAVRNLEWRFDYWEDVRGVATIVDNARLLVDFFMGPPGDYQVMKTDYDTFAYVYSYGGKVGSRLIQYGWVLARERTLPQSIVDDAFQTFEEQAGLKRSDFVQTQHGVAPYPPPAASARAVARKAEGEVDRQPNFDAVRYMGKWFEIYRSKNMPFEYGTDNIAKYGLNANGTVAVRNFEWRYDRWAVVSGVATVVDNARLSVDFFQGPPGDYQVMKTDYETFALVYSYAGKVGSRKLQYGWILARQDSLSQSLVDQAFEIFEEQAGMKRSDFEQTQHGVAAYPAPEEDAKL